MTNGTNNQTNSHPITKPNSNGPDGSTPIKTVGFIGLGVMGRSMALNLMKAGFVLQVYTRTKSSAQLVLDAGARWCDSPSQVALGADAIITIVGYPQDVRQTYFGDSGTSSSGLLNQAAPGTILIDMTTSSPKLAIEIAQAAEESSLSALDAPVSGGDIGAKEGRLSIMVGGTQSAFDLALPLFLAMGKTVVLQGGPGSGQYTKMMNQIVIASTMMGVTESLAYGQKAGLDLERVLESISSGAAGSWSLTNLAPRVIRGDYSPGFYVKHFIKDMGIALESAREMNLELPGLTLAHSLYQKLADQGGELLGTQGLFKLFE
jgi:3-hydroxyisobutyrate dehydrogenase